MGYPDWPGFLPHALSGYWWYVTTAGDSRCKKPGKLRIQAGVSAAGPARGTLGPSACCSAAAYARYCASYCPKPYPGGLAVRPGP